ncbi:MAG: DNA gyrase inhibitor YacG [Proteobacteria bacterium]|nr:DNA gyrase inhibitor YacG [Pseudomonadota bacterium]
MKTTEVKCPTCEKVTSFAGSNPFRPFCSDRCKLIDLGAWAAEDYKIPVNPQENAKTWEENNHNE